MLKKENIREQILNDLKNNILFKYLETNENLIFDRSIHEIEVRKELKHHIKDNLVSKLMLSQLIDLHGKRFTEINGKKHPYNLTYIYWRMEDVIKGKVKQKEEIGKV